MKFRRKYCVPRVGDVVRISSDTFKFLWPEESKKLYRIKKELTPTAARYFPPIEHRLRSYLLTDIETGIPLDVHYIHSDTVKEIWGSEITIDPFLTAAARAKRSWRGRCIFLLTKLKNRFNIRHA